MQANESERIRERALLRQPRARVRISIYIYILPARNVIFFRAVMLAYHAL